MLHISASGWILLTNLQSATSRPTDDDAKILSKNQPSGQGAPAPQTD